MEVDPGYYASQIVFFVWGAVLLGFFIKAVIDEVAETGWVKSPRLIWCLCLCEAAGIFILLQLDPRGALGLYPLPVLTFINWMAMVSIMISLALTASMYLIVLTRQTNFRSDLKNKRKFWVGLNLGFMMGQIILSLIGSITNNPVWYDANYILFTINEATLVLILNIAICKLTQGLKQQTTDVNNLGGKSDFRSALKKLWLVRVTSLTVFFFVICYQIAMPGGLADRLKSPSSTLKPLNNSSFSVTSLVGPFIEAGVITFFLYMSQRPHNRDQTSNSSAPDGTVRSATRGMSHSPSITAMPTTPSRASMTKAHSISNNTTSGMATITSTSTENAKPPPSVSIMMEPMSSTSNTN